MSFLYIELKPNFKQIYINSRYEQIYININLSLEDILRWSNYYPEYVDDDDPYTNVYLDPQIVKFYNNDKNYIEIEWEPYYYNSTILISGESVNEWFEYHIQHHTSHYDKALDVDVIWTS